MGNCNDPRRPYYVVYDQNKNPPKFAGYAPMGGADVSNVNPNLIINSTVLLSKFAVKTARRAGLIFGR